MPLEQQPTTLPKYNALMTADNVVNENFRRLEEIFEQYTGRQLNDHIRIEGITLTKGINNNIIHKLGRKPEGFFFTDCDDFFLYKNVASLTNTKQLTIQVTATVTCDMVVF